MEITEDTRSIYDLDYYKIIIIGKMFMENQFLKNCGESKLLHKYEYLWYMFLITFDKL